MTKDMRLERLRGAGQAGARTLRAMGIPDIAALAGLEPEALQRLKGGMDTQGRAVGAVAEPAAALIERHGLIAQARAIMEGPVRRATRVARSMLPGAKGKG